VTPEEVVSNFFGGSWFWPPVAVSGASLQTIIVRKDNMENKDQELASREITRSLDQMKSKILDLVEKMLRAMQQPELTKIAFSVQHWQDNSCSEEDLYIPRPPSEPRPKRLVVPNRSKDDERLWNWRKKVRHKLAKMGKDDLVCVIMEEADRMSYPNLQHLSQSLLALQRGKR
jgi:hypothetical protein